jgi:hypothetical protein
MRIIILNHDSQVQAGAAESLSSEHQGKCRADLSPVIRTKQQRTIRSRMASTPKAQWVGLALRPL